MPHAFVNRGSAGSDSHSYIGKPYARDARSDLGYGRIEAKFHTEYQQSSNYPYIDDDIDLPAEDVISDEDVDKFVKKVGSDHLRSDFGAEAGTDPFYFAAGNVKLSDAFFRTEQLIEAMTTFSNSMSPAPQIYKSKKNSLGRASGASFPSGVGSSKKTGSRRGFSAAPPLPKLVAVLDYEDDTGEEEEAYTLKDLAKAKTLGV